MPASKSTISASLLFIWHRHTCRAYAYMQPTNYVCKTLIIYIHIYIYLNTYMYICIYIHSFIHYGDLYSASSRLLLRNAPDPCTAKKNSFEAGVVEARARKSKCVNKDNKDFYELAFMQNPANHS